MELDFNHVQALVHNLNADKRDSQYQPRQDAQTDGKFRGNSLLSFWLILGRQCIAQGVAC